MSGPLDGTVVWLTLRQLFVRRRFIAALLFSLLPFALAVIFSLGEKRTDPQTARFLFGMYREFIVGTMLPLAAVVFGTAAFGGEFDEGAIVYLLVKPLSRWRIVASKYVVAVAATVLVMLPAIVLPWLQIGRGILPGKVPLVFAEGIGVGAVLYCALFLVLGLSSRRALIFGLIYVVALEFVLSRNAAGVKSLSVREFVLTVVGKLGEGIRSLDPGTVSLETVWWMGSIILVGALGLAVRRLGRFELAERL